MAADQFKHSVVVRPLDDGYVAEIPACLIVKTAPTAEQALAAAQTALAQAYKNYSDLGISPPAEGPSTTARERGLREQIQRTAINTGAIAILLLLLLVPLSFTLTTIYDRVESAVERTRLSAADLITPRALSTALTEAADMLEQITPERRNEIVEALDRIVLQLDPYADAVAPLLLGPQADRLTQPATVGVGETAAP